VTLSEKDVDKAVSVVRWLMWLVDDRLQGQEPENAQGSRSEGTISWEETIRTMQDTVQAALEERGLPPVEFS
jgi:DNA repair protein REV1